ncbi:MAG: IS630 family transposase [Methanosarcinaceae archaeon]
MVFSKILASPRFIEMIHHSHSVRRRAHSILLSAEGFSIGEIARIYQIHRDTVADIFDRWEKEGIQGLYDAPKSGRPPKLSEDEANEAIKFLKQDPRSIKKALVITEETTGKEISEWTLKRIVKKADLRWKRMRKSSKGKRDKTAFKRAKEEIAALHAQEAAGELDLYYFDETGFSLTPDVPYAWQAIGETLDIPSSRSKRINVLGFCNKEQDFHATTVQGSVRSATVIACFDEFCCTIRRKTTVIIDNASVHTSGEFKKKLGEWEKKGLSIKYLPTYSPELNLIEIVWRFIKYNWLPLTAYLSFKHLKTERLKVLNSIGSEYRITFA